MRKRDEGKARILFVAVALAAIALVVALVVMLGGKPDGARARAQELMPQIGAQAVMDQPGCNASSQALDEAELGYPLELMKPDGTIQQGATLASLPDTKILFLNFWATWCKPCVDELPSLLALARHLKGRPFTIVAVSYDESWNDIRAFFDKHLKRMPTELLLARDPAPGSPRSLRLLMGTSKIPESYVIENGEAFARFVNFRDWTRPDIREFFERLLEGE